MVDIKLEIKGRRELQRKAEQVMRDLHGEPMLKAMRDATLLVTRDGKKNAPVDTGRLRASITPEVRSQGEDMLGVVGSNVKYAPFVEFREARHKVGRSHYLQAAFEDAKTRIYALFDKALNKIANSK